MNKTEGSAAGSRREGREGGRKAGSAAPIVLALDDMSESGALTLARRMTGLIWGTKINDLLLRSGSEIIPRLKVYGGVFCDAKLHDIPNTVAHQVALLDKAGADLITVHCSGGADMLRAAVRAKSGRARLLGVTVLTALSDDATRAIYGQDASVQVGRMVELALECGLDGIICSPADLDVIRKVDPGHKLMRVTPGVRPGWYGTPDDQSRTMEPGAAIQAGADLLVIGRPITAAADPTAACERIAVEISELKTSQ